jgi:hypothetical protein
MSARHHLLFGSLVTAALGGVYGLPFLGHGADRTALLPGTTSRGHYPIEAACQVCHTPFEGVTNDACNRCHQAALAAAEDSHPERIFTDPRNADRVAGLDARACVTCHREHVPARTRPGGVTLPADFCAACHEDIGRERPSHRDFSFDGCAAGGCHHFHDNRGTYEGFLARHLHEPEVRSPARVALRVSVAGPPRERDADAPAEVRDQAVVREWEASAHARAGVGCAGCHEAKDARTGMIEWVDRPGRAACAVCHAGEEGGFLRGKHGMRLAVDLEPMTPGQARLPMKAAARDQPLGCDSCHPSHSADTRRAAVEACLSCHDDRHSRAYPASRHAQLWRREVRGSGLPGTGVSCATCHLPRQARRAEGRDVVRVEHDQNDNLRPNDRMIRGVCLGCHGLGFTIDALADVDLVARNFNGRPSVHVESLEMAERRLGARGGGP